MKERGIIFNGEMVRALLDGRKTMTRRIVKKQPVSCENGIDPSLKAAACAGDFYWPHPKLKGCGIVSNKTNGPDGYAEEHCPYGRIGDRQYVKEALSIGLLPALITGEPTKHKTAIYAADDQPVLEENGFDVVPWWTGWKQGKKSSPLLMPKWASRITLEITAVRVERLQSISVDDVKAEGFEIDERSVSEGGLSLLEQFGRLWDAIHGPKSWPSNPWVWVISFKRLESKEIAA